jgi:hypothetical protein
VLAALTSQPLPLMRALSLPAALVRDSLTQLPLVLSVATAAQLGTYNGALLPLGALAASNATAAQPLLVSVFNGSCAALEPAAFASAAGCPTLNLATFLSASLSGTLAQDAAAQRWTATSVSCAVPSGPGAPAAAEVTLNSRLLSPDLLLSLVLVSAPAAATPPLLVGGDSDGGGTDVSRLLPSALQV